MHIMPRGHIDTDQSTSRYFVTFSLEYPKPRGGTLIFSHIRRLGPFFWVQNSEFQYFFGFSEKLLFFWGMKILWIFFGVITKLG